jgi:hypothetical protein
MVRADGSIRIIAADATKRLQEKSCKTNNRGETSMTPLILKARRLPEIVAPKLQAIYQQFLHALDSIVEARIRNAVPEWRLRKAQREIKRSRRLMHADH